GWGRKAIVDDRRYRVPHDNERDGPWSRSSQRRTPRRERIVIGRVAVPQELQGPARRERRLLTRILDGFLNNGAALAELSHHLVRHRRRLHDHSLAELAKPPVAASALAGEMQVTQGRDQRNAPCGGGFGKLHDALIEGLGQNERSWTMPLEKCIRLLARPEMENAQSHVPCRDQRNHADTGNHIRERGVVDEDGITNEPARGGRVLHGVSMVLINKHASWHTLHGAR